MSDIWQQFADWERSEPLTPPEQLVLDMKDPTIRVWPGPDSSNDPQSTEKLGEEMEVDGAVGSPIAKAKTWGFLSTLSSPMDNPVPSDTAPEDIHWLVSLVRV
jgi:hypothetical protein